MVNAKLNRRQWVAALASAAAAPVSAQPAARDELLAEARADLQRALDRLNRTPLPFDAEPAVVFRP